MQYSPLPNREQQIALKGEATLEDIAYLLEQLHEDLCTTSIPVKEFNPISKQLAAIQVELNKHIK